MATGDVHWAGTGFGVKDSGARQTGPGGMLKEVTDKPWLTLIPTWFLRRVGEHMTKGAKKYQRNNWMKAESEDELIGFRDSAFRHFLQWLDNETDEDHMAAVCFNMWASEYVKERLCQ